jgi:hypothetical protein
MALVANSISRESATSIPSQSQAMSGRSYWKCRAGKPVAGSSPVPSASEKCLRFRLYDYLAFAIRSRVETFSTPVLTKVLTLVLAKSLAQGTCRMGTCFRLHKLNANVDRRHQRRSLSETTHSKIRGRIVQGGCVSGRRFLWTFCEKNPCLAADANYGPCLGQTRAAAPTGRDSGPLLCAPCMTGSVVSDAVDRGAKASGVAPGQRGEDCVPTATDFGVTIRLSTARRALPAVPLSANARSSAAIIAYATQHSIALWSLRDRQRLVSRRPSADRIVRPSNTAAIVGPTSR